MFNVSLIIFIEEKMMLKNANLSKLYLYKKYENKNINFKRVDQFYLENYNAINLFRSSLKLTSVLNLRLKCLLGIDVYLVQIYF